MLHEFCGKLFPLFWNSFQCRRQLVHLSSFLFSHLLGMDEIFIKGHLKHLNVLLNTENLQHQPQNILDDVVLQIPCFFRHRHCLRK